MIKKNIVHTIFNIKHEFSTINLMNKTQTININ